MMFQPLIKGVALIIGSSPFQTAWGSVNPGLTLSLLGKRWWKHVGNEFWRNIHMKSVQSHSQIGLPSPGEEAKHIELKHAGSYNGRSRDGISCPKKDPSHQEDITGNTGTQTPQKKHTAFCGVASWCGKGTAGRLAHSEKLWMPSHRLSVLLFVGSRDEATFDDWLGVFPSPDIWVAWIWQHRSLIWLWHRARAKVHCWASIWRMWTTWNWSVTSRSQRNSQKLVANEAPDLRKLNQTRDFTNQKRESLQFLAQFE